MKLIAFIVSALIYLAAPASASLTYVYQQTSAIPSTLAVQIEYTIADEAGAALNFDGPTRTVTGSFEGLLGFRFSGSSITKTLEQLISNVEYCLVHPFPALPCEFTRFGFEFRSDGASMHYIDTSDQFAFGEGFGLINTDNNAGRPCSTTGVCHFDGVFVPVPEPATMALFGASLFGLMRLRRRTTPPLRS